MQVIPDQRNSKTTALMLLVIALLLVYLLCFTGLFCVIGVCRGNW